MHLIIDETDIRSTLKDFETLCSFIASNKPMLTASGNLGIKACFELNNLMTYSEANAKKTDHMNRYPSITLYFMTGMNCGFLESQPVGSQKKAVTVTEDYAAFQQMNDFTKYLTLFLAWMRYFNYDELLWIRGLYGTNNIDIALDEIRIIGKPLSIERKDTSLGFSKGYDAIQLLMNINPIIMYHLRDFGIVSFKQEDTVKISKYEDFINKITITKLGLAISTACLTRKFTWVNEIKEDEIYLGYKDDVTKMYENNYEKNLPGSAGFLKPFLECFPKNIVDADAINRMLFPQKGPDSSSMVYEFKVQLDRSCYRVIQCRGDHTFEDLHLAIQKAFDFDNDHLYAFFMDGKRWSHNSISSPDSDKAPFADEVCIVESRLRVNQSIMYLFDFGDEWPFKVTLLKIFKSDSVILHPQIVKSVGESPEQYPGIAEEWYDDDDED
ncbi:MAG: plasmid pRiA4b ORF-3 family protein [Oscillospiraceae bacterium]|nr:plasmid pRiA4b ORF-3 family protein [Oscillospiraceae bacterium]